MSAPDVSRAPALTGESIALPPRRPIALIAIVLVIDLGLAAAGAVMLGKGLSDDKAEDKAPKKTEALPQKTEALPAPAPAEAPATAANAPSVPSATAIASVTTSAAPAIVPEAKPASAAADKSSASRRAKDKDRATTTKPDTESTKADAAKPEATKSDASGPVTSPSNTSPQDPYTETAPKLTTEQEVTKLVASSKSAFDRCAGAAQAHGKIQIAFQVLADGRVANAAAVENSTGNTELGQCLVATIRGWTLSPHSGPTASFVRPFNYP